MLIRSLAEEVQSGVPLHFLCQSAARVVVVGVLGPPLDEGPSAPVVLVQRLEPVLREGLYHVPVLAGSLAYDVDLPAFSLLQVHFLVTVQRRQLRQA
jgi:hypothetical protein